MPRKLVGGVDLNGQRGINAASPTSATDIANKAYVDNVAAGLAIKPSVRAATTANITLSATQTVDGVSLVVGDRVLVKNQTDATKNGIYVVAAGAWTLASDSTQGELLSGALVIVDEGSTLDNTMWILTTNNPITVGTTALTFSQFQVGITYTAGTGITISGGQIAVNIDGTTIVATAGVLGVSSAGLAALGFARKQAFTLAAGSTSTAVTHTLNSTDLQVTAQDISGAAPVPVDLDYVFTSATVVTFTTPAAVVASQYRVVLEG